MTTSNSASGVADGDLEMQDPVPTGLAESPVRLHGGGS